jgi:chromosome segregation ATPase
MTVTRKSRWRIDYEVTSPPDEDRDVIIDELRQDGWTPTAEMKDIEETPSRLRMKISAPKGKTTKAALIREHIDQEQIRLDELEPERILATISGLENESASVKEAVAKLSVIIGDMNKANAQRERIEKEREAITQDQQRIRSNLSSVGQSSDLGRRYLDALRNQEDRLTALAQDNKSIDAKLEQAREAAEAVAKQLTL